jgi:hypothetical protein
MKKPETKRMKNLIWAMVAVNLLAGCDTFEDMASAQQPKHIEISAGKQVQIDGQKVAIAGTSQCLADTSRHDCIVITPDTKAVEVLVGYPGQPRREAWTVNQVGDQRLLKSGKGSIVISAD